MATTLLNSRPDFEFLTPFGREVASGFGYNITWSDVDPEENAQISLYYDTDNINFDGTLIVENIKEDDELDFYQWDISNVEEGSYYLYAVISDGVNSDVKMYSQGYVDVVRNSCSPPISGDWTITGDCILQVDITAPANILLESGATLTIESGATLFFDSLNYKFIGEESSYVNRVVAKLV